MTLNKSISLLWIFDRKDYFENKSLVNQFFELYENPSNFPDPNERENTQSIIGRITLESNAPHTYLLIAQNKDSNILCGGAILEVYPESQCALLTYIFTHPNMRGKGVGKTMIMSEVGLKLGIEKFENTYNKNVKALFFESNNPEMTDPSEDAMLPSERLIFFKKLGAKILDIPYVQPSLDVNKSAVQNLLLLTFPKFGIYSNNIDAKLFLKFYVEFCQALSVEPTFYILTINKIKTYLFNKYGNPDFILLI